MILSASVVYYLFINNLYLQPELLSGFTEPPTSNEQKNTLQTEFNI